MGIVTEAIRSVTLRTGLEQGPLPLTAAKVVEWLDGGAPTATGVRVGPDTAFRIAAAYSCIRIISEDVAKLPLQLLKVDGKSKSPATDHPLYNVLHRIPNPHMTAMQLRETMQAHVLTRGNAYANIERDGRDIRLWPLRPDRMDPPVLSAAGTLLYTYHLPNGEPRALTQGEVLHLRGLSPDGIMGYSPVQLQRETLGNAVALQEYGSRFFGNGARPGGLLTTDKRLSTEAAERLKKSWEAAHQGLTNAHRIAVLEEGVDYKQVGIAPEDAQYLESRKLSRSEVAGIFRVPPHKIADLQDATFSNIEEQEIQYLTDTLHSWLERWEQQIYKDLLLPAEQRQYIVKHNMNALLRAKAFERGQFYQLMIQQGVFSPNDVLELEDMNPFEGGDVHLQQANMVPFGTEPQPAAAPAPSRMRILTRTAEGLTLEERDGE